MDTEILKLLARLRSSLICCISDDGATPVAGGGDGTDIDGGESTPDPNGGEGQGQQAKTYSEAEVERIKQQAFADARRKYGNKPGPKPRAENPAPPNSGTDVLEQLRLRDEFDDVTDGLELSRPQKKRLRSMFFTERPDDADEWMRENIEVFGIGIGKTQSQSSSPPTTEPPKPTGPPASNAGTPGGARDSNKVTNPNDLTKDDVQRLREEHGPYKANAMIRDMALKYGRANGA